jgi:hypothetical protein
METRTIEYKDTEGSNLQIKEEADETEKSVLQGEDGARNNRKLAMLHVQPTRIFI